MAPQPEIGASGSTGPRPSGTSVDDRSGGGRDPVVVQLSAASSERAGLGTQDEELLRQFLAGDDRACRAVERWAREIVRFRPYGVPVDEHDDIVQQALMALWRACSESDFVLRTSLRGFVRKVVMARCVDWLRRRRPSTEIDETVPDPHPGPTDVMEESEQWARARWAIGRLGPACQELIRLHFLENLPYARIAADLGRAEGTLRVRMFQCMEQVRRLLGSEADRP